MHWLTQLFIAALSISTLTQWWLSVRQTRYVNEHRDRVPGPFAERISADQHRKAADYTLAQERLGRVHGVLDVFILLVLTLGGGIAFADAQWQRSGLGEPWLGTAVILSIVFAQALVGLPLSVY